MCGIVGLFAPDGPVDERALRRLAAAVAPRGAEGEDFFVEAGAGLGLRRALTGAHAPCAGEDRRVVAVFDGEIVNQRALILELLGLGHRFVSRDPAELVAHAFEEWGDTFLVRIEGLFALAVWDTQKKQLLLARDRLGERPLYWTVLPRGGLGFASTLAALGTLSGVSREVDPGTLARYLVHGHVPAPRAMWRGVHKLEAGTLLTYTPGRTPITERWWQLPMPRSTSSAGRLTSVSLGERELTATVRRAVRERLTAADSLGVWLSGGLDSALVAALAGEERAGLPSFSLAGGDDDRAARVAAHVGAKHHVVSVGDAELFALAERAGELFDEPLGDIEVLTSHLLARATREHADVVLSGTGGDELFAGHPNPPGETAAKLLWDAAPALVSAPVGVAAGLVAKLLPAVADPGLRQWLRVGAAGRGVAERRHQAWSSPFLPSEARRMMAPELGRQAARHPDELWDVVDSQLRECPASDARDRLTWLYTRGFLADAVLPRLDRASQSAGLEVRAPLLDTRVVDLACRLHPGLRLRGLAPKYLLKRVAKGLLPADIVADRPVAGPPLAAWLRGPLAPLVDELLLGKKLREDGQLAAAPIHQLVAEHRAGRDHGRAIWTLLAFAIWRESYSGI